MVGIKWLVNRLKAMSPAEIAWRLQQKSLQNKEKRRFADSRVSACGEVLSSKYVSLKFYAAALHLNLENTSYGLNEDINLLGFKYEDFKGKWHAGFQTENEWPQQFAYSLEYRQRDEIGDARTNWELNRHFQFAILAKNYRASGDERYLHDLKDQLNDWDKQNPFLVGISWTSVMELAIRAINWMYTLALLEDVDELELKRKLAVGAINMVDHIEQHRSRFSSANNHLLVEAAAIGIAGFAFSYKPWVTLAIEILTEELERQNYGDGVNKELSLHYQVFAMEAYALVGNLLLKNGGSIPVEWASMLNKQCRYVSDCRGAFGEVVVFGDDDEGKILDLVGKGADRYAYILQFMSTLLDERYDAMEQTDETLHWLFDESEIGGAKRKPLYDNAHNACYREGGNTILKSRDGRILIGIDHAALGFGSIAAHGHADALSFQMFVDGSPVFIDPGTYIYHCNLPMRNSLRKTSNHNTVCADGKDQSEMLGAFLWGRKANCKLLSYEERDDGGVELVAEHDGYAPLVHRRTFEFDGRRFLAIRDELFNDAGDGFCGDAIFACPESLVLSRGEGGIAFKLGDVSGQIESSGIDPSVEKASFSANYGVLQPGKKIKYRFSGILKSTIRVSS